MFSRFFFSFQQLQQRLEVSHGYQKTCTMELVLKAGRKNSTCGQIAPITSRHRLPSSSAGKRISLDETPKFGTTSPQEA